MSKLDRLAALKKKLEKDKPLLPLGDSEEPVVPGDGSAESAIVLIGEGPGYHESVQRKPFVGRSGQLLNQTLADVGFPREQVYITNIIKIRPPENRDPTPAEILAFKPYLDEEIEIIEPQLIVTLGRYSMGKFLPNVKISQVHGRLHQVNWNGKNLFILPMYHPSAALRNPATKEAFVKDFQKLPKIMAWIPTHLETEALAADIEAALI